MSISSNITDPATGLTVEVGQHRQLVASLRIPDVLPVGAQNRYTMYNALMGSAGAVESGITNANMNQNGSVTEQEFYIGAEELVDIRITKLVIIIADSAVAHNAFGNVAALTNGFGISVFERGITTNIATAVKTGGQFIAQSGMAAAYGNTTTSFELSNWTGTEDAQTIVIDIAEAVPGGIRIARGTEDRICATVRDDLTGLSEFTIRVLGHRHHE